MINWDLYIYSPWREINLRGFWAELFHFLFLWQGEFCEMQKDLKMKK
jgi:hypothetical protein